MNTRQTPFSTPLLHRLTAMGLAVLVLGLGMMSVSPDLHDWAHHEHTLESEGHCGDQENPPASDANHSCVIVAYAGGITLGVDPVAPAALPTTNTFELAITSSALLPASPAHLLPPGRGPPVSLS